MPNNRAPMRPEVGDDKVSAVGIHAVKGPFERETSYPVDVKRLRIEIPGGT